MNQVRKYQKDEDVLNLLGISETSDNANGNPSPLSPDEMKKRLRKAQNINRGHPRKGEAREELKQINVSCLQSISERFTDLSLKTGKTKRTLLEEAIKHLTKKYDR